VSAGADLVVEGAVDLVLFCSKDGGEVVGHGCGGSREVEEGVGTCRCAQGLRGKMSSRSGAREKVTFTGDTVGVRRIVAQGRSELQTEVSGELQ
jgi:hypothetical protein